MPVTIMRWLAGSKTAFAMLMPSTGKGPVVGSGRHAAESPQESSHIPRCENALVEMRARMRLWTGSNVAHGTLNEGWPVLSGTVSQTPQGSSESLQGKLPVPPTTTNSLRSES